MKKMLCVTPRPNFTLPIVGSCYQMDEKSIVVIDGTTYADFYSDVSGCIGRFDVNHFAPIDEEIKVMVGSKVKILEERHVGMTGTITATYPPNAYSPERLYRVRYDNSFNSGMFESSELSVLEEGE